MEQSVNSESLFDRSARDFAEITDRSIASNAYTRGQLFVQAVKNHIPHGGLILDYGCGPGRISRLVAELGYRIHGLDPSIGMLTEARKQQTAGVMSFDHLTDNGESLESAHYDGVICSSTIEYVTDAAALLANFQRALRKEGVLVISYANRLSLWRKYSEIRNRHTAPHLKLQHHIWRFRQFKPLLERAGFCVTCAPVFFDAAPFDRRPRLRRLSASPWIGTLGLVVARCVPPLEKVQ